MNNEQKAIDFVLNENKGFLIDENTTCYFDSIEEAFEWLILDENSKSYELRSMIKTMKSITVKDMKEVGAKSVEEYMVLNHEFMYNTPFGLVYIQ